MKKLLLISLFVAFTFLSHGQKYTIESSPNTGYFMFNSVDYVKGHYEIKYEGRVSVDTLRKFSLVNIYTGQYLINSRYYTKIDGVNNWDELSELLERLGVVNITSTDKPFNQQVAENLISGYDSEFKFGSNDIVGAVEEVIWDAGGTYVFLTAAETMDIVSTDADDNGTGSGARLLIVYGLNADYIETSQVITMNGLTPVTTDTAFLRVFRAIVLTSGTDSPTADANEGTITIEFPHLLNLIKYSLYNRDKLWNGRR